MSSERKRQYMTSEGSRHTYSTSLISLVQCYEFAIKFRHRTHLLNGDQNIKYNHQIMGSNDLLRLKTNYRFNYLPLIIKTQSRAFKCEGAKKNNCSSQNAPMDVFIRIHQMHAIYPVLKPLSVSSFTYTLLCTAYF